MYSSYFLALLIFAGSFAFANSHVGEAPSICATSPQGPVQEILFSHNSGTCRDAEALAELLHQLSIDLGRSVPVKLVVGLPDNNAGFDEGQLIYMPSQFVLRGPYGHEIVGDISKLDPIVAHEYGHALLLEIWKKEFSEEFGEIFQELADYSNQAEKTIRAKLKVPAYKTQHLEKMKFYQESLTAYGELYADVIAVYYFRDPSIMFKSLYFDEMSDQEFKYVQLRDFARAHEAHTLARWGDPHSQLAPVRTYIGKNFWPRNQFERRKYLNIIEGVLVESARQDVKVQKKPNSMDLNKRLIKLLEKARN